MQEKNIKEIVKKGDASALNEALASNPLWSSFTDMNGRTLAHEAAEWGHSACLDILKAAGADLSPRDNMGQTPLHRSLIRERDSASQWLINNGADINMKDQQGVAPILLAARFSPVVFDDLVQKGADVSVTCKMNMGVEEWNRMGEKENTVEPQAQKAIFKP